MRVRATTTRKEEPTVATDISIALEELLDKTGADVDFLREAVRALVQELMEIEVTRQIGAAMRIPLRSTTRSNGWRPRVPIDADHSFQPMPTARCELWAPILCSVHGTDRHRSVQLIRGHLLSGLSIGARSEEHTSELQSRENLVCRLLLEKKNLK